MRKEFLNSTTDGNKRDRLDDTASNVSSSPFTFATDAANSTQSVNSPLQDGAFSIDKHNNSTVRFDSRDDSGTYFAEKKPLPTCRS